MSNRGFFCLFLFLAAFLFSGLPAYAEPVKAAPIPATKSVAREDSCETEVGEYRTQTGGGWGQDECQNNNVACFRDQYFPLVYPNGVTIGGTHTIRFTSSQAVAAYLPRGTTLGVLTQNYVNPTTTTQAGIFASHVLCLQLSVSFGDHGVPTFGDLGPLVVNFGPFAGYTVDEVLSLANTVLGGNPGALPPGKTLSDLSATVDNINNNFVDGLEDDGYLDEVCCVPPRVVCWTGNPDRFTQGQALELSAVVTNPDSDLYVVSGYYSTGTCSGPALMTLAAADRWMMTVPANCTQGSSGITATFVVTDSCGMADTVTCDVPACELPEVSCWGGNPANFEYGQQLTVCAVVNDGDGDLVSVTAQYTAGTCHATVPATFSGGRWCVTIPGECLQTVATVSVVFVATDSCGQTGIDTCLVPAECIAPDVVCWEGNPDHFNYGQGFTACALVTDPNNDVVSVEASYQVDGCTRTLAATNLGDGRWCVTIPDSCTLVCSGAATIIFTAWDACNLCGVATCLIPVQSALPLAECWIDNPATFQWGQPLTLCALVSDPDDNVATVNATYTIETCSATVPATDAGGGRWCITIPGECTQACSPATVVFAATDMCGITDHTTCIVAADTTGPTVACGSDGPYRYVYGQPLEVCATVFDPDDNVVSVTALYALGSCSTQVAATFNGGRWCAAIPANCTGSCLPGYVTFTATDACGTAASQTCELVPWDEGPAIACASGNPAEYAYGEPLTVCADVADSGDGISSVSAHYAGALCDTTVDATWDGQHWCVTVPGSCTQSYQPIAVEFTASGPCGLTGSATCVVPSVDCHPPVVACWPDNPDHYVPGESFTACAIVADPDNDLASVFATYVVGECSVTVAAESTGGGRWCVAVPASCTDACDIARVVFRATDSCQVTGTDTCTFSSTAQPPAVECWSGNPDHYAYGIPLTVCAVASDPDNDVVTVAARYTVGECSYEVPTEFADGRWCVTIPETCTETCGADAIVVFVASDECGRVDSISCAIPPDNAAPEIVCSPANPAGFAVGQPLTACAVSTDADDNVTGVSARYITGGCDQTVAAALDDDGWCVTIPGECTQSCSLATIIFTAMDACGATAADTCYFQSNSQAPVLTCWEQNPDSFAYDEPLTICATVTDADHDVASVSVSYRLGGCLESLPAGYAGNGRWCITIPAACTQFCDSAIVTFTATDACGHSGAVTCTVLPRPSTPPNVLCEASDPPLYAPGQPVTAYAAVTDPENDIVLVTASYATATCVITDTADFNAALGRWFVVIPGNCTAAGGDINVTFIATDHCGMVDAHTCVIPPLQIPCMTNVAVHCWTGNPQQFAPGLPLEMCAVVDDWPGAIPVVRARYTTGTCTDSLNASWTGDRWCVSIPGACTQANIPIEVAFFVIDTCEVIRSIACTAAPSGCHPPDPACWIENPGEYGHGQPVTICVEAEDPDNDIASVAAHYITGACNTTVDAVSQGGTRWCVTIPGTCTQSYQPLQVIFTAVDACGLAADVTCFIQPPEPPDPDDACCLLCVSDPATIITGLPLHDIDFNMELVIQMQDEHLSLSWRAVPGAEYYRIYRGDPGTDFDQMEDIGTVPASRTEWIDSRSIAELPRQQHYQVRAYHSQHVPALLQGDRGQWEFNEGAGDTVHDASGYNRHALRWSACRPDWGHEYDQSCDSNFAEFMDFDGFVYNPQRCPEHVRAPNDTVYYRDRFQVFARIRIHQHPNNDTGPFYIVSNRTYGTAYSGGFGFRIEPGWYTDQNNIRRWHNRLLGIVWDRTVDDGIWRQIASAHPTPQDTVTNSVPLNEWVCVWMIVNGDSSMLIIDERIVATGNLTYRSLNTGAPMVIGGGYHHSTLPVENPFRGEMDCVRITDLP